MRQCQSLLALLGTMALASCLDSVNEDLWKGRDGLQVSDAGTVDVSVDAPLDGLPPDTGVPDGPAPDTWTPVPDTWTPVPDTWTPVPDTWTPQQDASGAPTPSTSPIVAASTTGYGMVWVDAQSGTPAVMFRMLDGSGTPLIGPTTVVAGPVQALTSMIWSGQDFRLVYIDASGIQRVTINESGTFVTGKTLGPAGAKWAQIVKAGTVYGLAFSTATQVLLQRLDQNSNKQGAPTVVYTAPSTGFSNIGSYRSPMLAHGDGHYGVVFAVESGSGQAAQGPLYFARVTTAGALVGSAQQVQAGPALYPAVGHGSGQFTVTWHASGGPGTLRVDAVTGAVTASATLLGGDSCSDHAPMVPTASTGLVEVWTACASGNGVGLVGLDSANGAKLLGPQVVLPRTGLNHPWIASHSNGLGVVWADTTLGVSEIFFSRLASGGTPVGTPLRISP